MEASRQAGEFFDQQLPGEKVIRQVISEIAKERIRREKSTFPYKARKLSKKILDSIDRLLPRKFGSGGQPTLLKPSGLPRTSKRK